MVHIEKTVSVAGAAELAGVTEFAVRAAVQRGEMTVITSADGRLRGIAVKDVEKWIATPRKRGPKPRKKA